MLECMLRQLLATRQALLESNGGFGAPFHLADYLRPGPHSQPAGQQQQDLLPLGRGRKWHQQ